ncbi:MAG: hypothetical protein WBA54_05005 [Acidaminobacteraceae bacterium]
MKKNTNLKKVIKCLSLIFVIAFFSKVYYELKFWDLTVGMIKLEKKKKDVVLVSKKAIMLITKGTDKDNEMIEEMYEYGFEYVNKYGRGYLFTRDDEEVVLFKKEHLGRYSVYEIEGSNLTKEELRELA